MKIGRATSGEPLTVLLIAVSILGGIALAIACSYRPIALWWVMIACSAINVIRFGARLSRQSRGDRPGAPTAHSPIIALAARGLARSLDAFAGARSGTSKASLDRQHARFLVWFTEHNLLWTTIGFGVSLLLWHRFGPTAPALVVMAALMSTRQNGATRFDAAVAALRSMVAPQQSAIACFTLSAFDSELTTIADNVGSAAELVDLVSRLQPRPLGTELSLVQRALAETPRAGPLSTVALAKVDNGCATGTTIVVSDMPAPPWMERQDGPASRGDVWIDVSQPAPNAGIVDLVDTRDRVSGQVQRVRILVSTFAGMLTKAWPLTYGTRSQGPSAPHLLEELHALRETIRGAAELFDPDPGTLGVVTQLVELARTHGLSQVSNRRMKDLDGVISSINRCTFDVLQRAHLAIDGMRGLDRDMDSLADIRERSKGIASVSDLLNGIDGVTRALRDRVSALEHEVGEALRQAEAQSEDEQRRAEAFIESLEARRADLRTRLRQTPGGQDGPDGRSAGL